MKRRWQSRAWRWAASLALLPVCAASAPVLARVLRATGEADTFWVPFAGGVAIWLLCWMFLPAPMLVYVFGHELTHALFTWMSGGRVKGFKATSKGGHVKITKTNFVITLAPYFFPLYAAMVVAAFALLRLVDARAGWTPVFHLALGLAFAFHITLTIHALRTKQSDIEEEGWLFSAVVIWLGNMLVLLCGLSLLTGRIGLITLASWWAQAVAKLLRTIANGMN